jgi:hypothetical protein
VSDSDNAEQWPREPEVEQLHAMRRQEDVRRLQIAMDDSFPMERGKRTENGQRGLNRVTCRQRPPGETLAEWLAFEKFHCQE